MELDKDKIIEALTATLEQSKTLEIMYQNIINNMSNYYNNLISLLTNIQSYSMTYCIEGTKILKKTSIVIAGVLYMSSSLTYFLGIKMIKKYTDVSYSIDTSNPFGVTYGFGSKYSDLDDILPELTNSFIYKHIDQITSMCISDDFNQVTESNDIPIVIVGFKY